MTEKSSAKILKTKGLKSKNKDSEHESVSFDLDYSKIN